MKGYPKTLNTMADYEYVRANFPAALWKPDWQALLDTMYDWVPIAELDDESKGITDETHKVTENTQTDKEKATTWTQWEWQEMPDCKLLRLGFAKEYIQNAIESAAA